MSNKPIGQAFVGPSNALSYTDPFIEIFMDRAPTTRDINYPVQKRWFDKSTNIEYVLKGFSSSFDTEFNQTVLSAEWESTAISNALLKFTAGSNTSGTFPILPNVSKEISIGSSLNTVQVTGGVNSLDLNINLNYLTTGKVTFNVPVATTVNGTYLTLTTGTWIVYGYCYFPINMSASISINSLTLNTDNLVSSINIGLVQIFPLIVTVIGFQTVYLVVQNLDFSPSSVFGTLTAVKLGV